MPSTHGRVVADLQGRAEQSEGNQGAVQAISGPQLWDEATAPTGRSRHGQHQLWVGGWWRQAGQRRQAGQAGTPR